MLQMKFSYHIDSCYILLFRIFFCAYVLNKYSNLIFLRKTSIFEKNFILYFLLIFTWRIIFRVISWFPKYPVYCTYNENRN